MYRLGVVLSAGSVLYLPDPAAGRTRAWLSPRPRYLPRSLPFAQLAPLALAGCPPASRSPLGSYLTIGLGLQTSVHGVLAPRRRMLALPATGAIRNARAFRRCGRIRRGKR